MMTKPLMGINVATDKKAGKSYADLIVDGHKAYESRNSDTLRPYVGKRVSIVRTGNGPAKAIGEVTVGEPMVVGKKQFREMEPHHLVPEGSAFDISTPSKHLYPMHNPVRYETERDVGHGIVARKVIYKASGGEVMDKTQRDANLAKFLAESHVQERLYHATPKDFSEFKLGGHDPSISGHAVWLSNDPQRQPAAHHVGSHAKPKPNVQVMPVHAQVKKPMVLDDENMLKWAQAAYANRSPEFPELMPKEWADNVRQDYDSIILADPYKRGEPHEVIMFHPNRIKSAIGNRGTYDTNETDITKAKGGSVNEPKGTVKAYKLFRVHPHHPGKLFPLFVDANTPVEMGKWVNAKEGEMSNGKVKSKIGALAYRPGWHAGDLPVATHIGEKSHPSLTAPDQRPAHHAWAEVEMPNDVDWQSEATRRGTNAQGKVIPVKAHITDQIPHGGHYRYKTNPNMTGNWLIGGSMKVNKVLSDAEVAKINRAAGMADLPRAKPFKKKEFGFAHGGCVGPDEWKAEEHVNYPAIIRKAIGGSMNTPSLAQMRVEIGRHSNPEVMGNIGVNEAVDIQPKIFVNPNPNSPGMPDVGGVKTPKGALPVGGVDTNPQQPGQQMMPQQPQQQTPSGPPSQAPTGPTPPMGNMLQMTKQGQALGAMQPPQQGMAKGGPISLAQMRIELNKAHHFAKGGSATADEPMDTTQRMLIKAEGPNGVKGIVVPRHMWEGKTYKTGEKIDGMRELNKARAEVYGAENRQPLTIGQIGRIHKQTLADHFQKPLSEQMAAEDEALNKLRAARHIHRDANTLDASEKLDTVKHEIDDQGRTHVGFASKGVAGHSLYTSGHGSNQIHHVLNTCPGQTEGCGGGKDENGIVDTSKGTCFAPNAESQYVNASVRRACHEQAKHDPAMTRDWILAHTGSLRKAAKSADKNNERLLFRPNVVDETDTSSRHVLRHLNEQRKIEDKPPIIANSYGKTNELHDPENGYYVTHSNVGPKTKHGQSIAENISRDKARVRNTIYAADNQGDFKNEQGHKTPPKGSYMVTNVKRDSPFDKEMQKTITHAKYWSAPREQNELSAMERDEGDESHYDGKGRPTTPDKSHYGHIVFDGRRYDYQKQHILHPRLVQVGTNDDGTPHMIPTDSRFQDTKFLPQDRFKTRNGKEAGPILMTTPTESTSNVLHHTSFTHDVNPVHLEYAKHNNGEYEIDPPLQQEFARNKEYVAPQPIKIVKMAKKARGGRVAGYQLEYNDEFNAFPEQDSMAQHHLAKRTEAQE